MAIVGGAGGIGRALTEAATTLALDVTVLDLRATLAEHPPPCRAIPLDVTDEAAVIAAFAGLGPLDAVVNLAGFAPAKSPVADLPLPTWDAVLAANLTGAFLVARAALTNLRGAGQGAIVNVASGLAARMPPGYAAYSASKAGLIALTKALAAENAPAIRASAVAPGPVRTAFLSGGASRPPRAQQINPGAAPIAEPEDIVGPILFLCAPASRFMTGQVLWINGGSMTP